MTEAVGHSLQVHLDSSDIALVCDSSNHSSVLAIAGCGGSFVVADADGGLQMLRLQCE